MGTQRLHLAFGGLLLLGGRLGDTFGRLRVFEIGLVVFTASSLLGGLAQSPTTLIAARVAQGIGAALAAPGVLALVTTSARDEAGKNRALALFSAVGVGGGTLGLVLGGLVTEFGSWRWTLFINVTIGIGVLALARRFVTETPRNPGRFDVVGAISATGAAAAVVWALIGAPEKGWTSLQTFGGLAVGVMFIAVLAVTERRVTHPSSGRTCFAADAGSADWRSSRWYSPRRSQRSSSSSSTSSRYSTSVPSRPASRSCR
ncbi:MFS transporter [Streptomyces sp. NPDC058690]|uniref:MFS transporter n=1 Tax=Streptomyces sp. NPDC058690 TaxID=3346600 RepID=UPI003657BD20